MWTLFYVRRLRLRYKIIFSVLYRSVIIWIRTQILLENLFLLPTACLFYFNRKNSGWTIYVCMCAWRARHLSHRDPSWGHQLISCREGMMTENWACIKEVDPGEHHSRDSFPQRASVALPWSGTPGLSQEGKHSITWGRTHLALWHHVIATSNGQRL